MTTGQWVLVLVVLASVAFGCWRLWTDGRFRGASSAPAHAPVPAAGVPAADDSGADDVHAAESLLAGTPFAGSEGTRATFVQFSSAFCAPCRVTRRTLDEVTSLLPDVSHVEIDAELHLDLVRRVDVLRTPTTIVLDSSGREVTRASGAPTKAQVLQALALVDSVK